MTTVLLVSALSDNSMQIVIELINGLKLGLEYVSADSEDPNDVNLVVFDLLFLRFMIIVP
jgi:hypothetical protein